MVRKVQELSNVANSSKVLPAFFPGSLSLGSCTPTGFKSDTIFCEGGMCLFNFPILFCSLEEQLASITIDYF